MTRFYTSDLHFNHGNIIGYCDRPYSNTWEMNTSLVENWNETVTEKDEVIIIGDLIMGQLNKGLHLVSQLNGKKYLIPGNHDKVLPINKPNETKIQKYIDAGITFMNHFELINIDGIRIGLSHFPHTTNPNYKYYEYVPKNNGQFQILFCGHVHEKWLTNKNQINVGVDQWDYKPVPQEWLIQMARKLLAIKK